MRVSCFSALNMLATLFAVAVVNAAWGQGPAAARAGIITKSAVEAGSASLVARARLVNSVNSGSTAAGGVSNPKVQPGLVHWHATMDEARLAARRSGRPILLFQMMGNLDEQFC